jgi:F-type H+-transporting ATPase subunit b
MRAVIATSFVLLAPSAALAAGMPQLDFANPLTAGHAVWMLVIFGLLYFIMERFALPAVQSVLDERAAAIRADLDSAAAASTAAKAAQAELDKAEARARAEAQAAVRGAMDHAKAQAATASEAVNARLSASLAEAEGRIAAEKGRAMAGIGSVATGLASDVVHRVAGITPDRGAIESAVSAALAARQGA